MVTTVDATACHAVNQTTSQVEDRPSVSVIAVVLTASTTSVTNGHA